MVTVVDLPDSDSASVGGASEPKLSTLFFWTAVLVAALAGLARAVRVQLPTLGIVSSVLSVIGVSVVVAAARYGMSRSRQLLAAVLGLGVGTTAVVASTQWGFWDSWGFAGLGLGIFSLVSTVDVMRRSVAARGESCVPLAFTALSAFSFVLVLLSDDLVAVFASLASIIFGALAIELWSAVFPTWLSDHSTLAGVTGAAILIGASRIFLIDVDQDSALWIVVAVGVATALLIISNNTTALLGTLAVAIVWSGVPRVAPDQPGRAPDAGSEYWAVLGDSYISGEGAEAFLPGTNTTATGEDNESAERQCRRAPTAWPLLLNPPDEYGVGAMIGVPARVLFIACSGAVTMDIRRQVQDDRAEPEQLERLSDEIERLGRPPNFVVVSVGGNDLQFSDVGKQCVLPGDCTEFINAVRTSRLDEVGNELERTYAEIRMTVGPSVPVVAIPYPIPAHEGSSCRGVLLSETDVHQINGFARSLNEEVASAAASQGLYVMGTIAESLSASSAQLCEPHAQSGLNFADLNPKGGRLWSALQPLNWTHNFIHPNEAGHEVLAAAALDWFDENPCILAGDCGEIPITDTMADRAREPRSIPAQVQLDPFPAIADVAPVVILTTAALACGWWLLLTALVGWRRTGEVASSRIGRRTRPLWILLTGLGIAHGDEATAVDETVGAAATDPADTESGT